MKKLYILALLLISSITSFASHELGVEIRYEYIGGQYVVDLSVMTDCMGSNIGTTAILNYKSTSCAVNMTRIAHRYTVDTMKYAYCSSIVPVCGTQFIPTITHFRDTVSLTQCSAWKISYTSVVGQNGLIANIVSPGQRALYAEAFLNNSTAPNSSPIFDNVPVFTTAVNSHFTQPLAISDIEGDSIAAVMINPQDTGGTNMTYTTGYSVAQPMGSGSSTQINAGNGTLKTFGTNLGTYLLEARASDYRNGVLVGYSSREWMITNSSSTNPNAPLPAAGSNFSFATCPGQTHSYTFHFIDSSGTDSVFLSFVPPNNGISYTTSYLPGLDSATATISWTTPANYNPVTDPHFIIKLFATDNHCPNTGYGTYYIMVHATYCSTDTVWSGDANADKVVDMYDPLFIALAYGSTGVFRAGASTAWAPQWCANWASSFNTGVNYKHADCDGNGTVNSSDLSAVTANYGQTHPKEVYQQLAKQAGVPDLYFDHSGLNIYPGAAVSIPVKLGNTTSNASMLGIASRLKINGITPSNVSISYPAASWLGTSANTIRFSKSTTTNSIDWAYARTDHQSTIGQGSLATLNFTIPSGTAGQKIVLTLENTRMISQTGSDITSYNVLSDTLNVWPLSIGNNPSSSINSAVVIPNPSNSNAVLEISLSRLSDIAVSVIDITGRIVWNNTTHSNSNMQEINLPTGLQAGMYMIQVKTNNDIQTVKWIKE